MATGKVKWFNNAKGYGFILPEHGGEDLFAHYSTIQMDGYKTLKAGQDVVFDVESGPKGLHAINIRALAVDGIAMPNANGDALNGHAFTSNGTNGAAINGAASNGATMTLGSVPSPLPA
jgi:CspA family cold shock protein